MELIEGVRVKPLRVIPDERGWLMEVLRMDDEIFKGFGQVYITTAYPGVVKAWHAHEAQTDNIACITGMVKLVLYDERESSPTRGMINEFFIGEKHPILVQVPPKVWHGFKNIHTDISLVINIPDRMYNYEKPDELRRPAHGDIPYDWGRKDG